MPRSSSARAVRFLAVVMLLATALVLHSAWSILAQSQGPTERPTTITAAKYRFEPSRIEVLENDLVRIELKTADIAHSFTIDGYRIAKRVNPGSVVAFEFRADKTGRFPFYCNLQIEDGCRQMQGELVVAPRR